MISITIVSSILTSILVLLRKKSIDSGRAILDHTKIRNLFLCSIQKRGDFPLAYLRVSVRGVKYMGGDSLGQGRWFLL